MTKITNKDILHNIKKVTLEHGTTMEEISKEMGKTKSYLSSALSKNKSLIRLEILLWISDRFKVDINILLAPRQKNTTH